MEASSPLASLQPNHPGPFAQRCREYTSHFLAPNPWEPRSFNFKDMSMLKPKTDYFTFNPVRGSSPTTSLAADLSQNFHIEQRLVLRDGSRSDTNAKELSSPAFPTPRRTLFNSNPTLHSLRTSRRLT